MGEGHDPRLGIGHRESRGPIPETRLTDNNILTTARDHPDMVLTGENDPGWIRRSIAVSTNAAHAPSSNASITKNSLKALSRFIHEFPPNLDRKDPLNVNQGTKQNPLVSLFRIGAGEFGVCTSGGTINAWNGAMALTTNLELNITCTAATCYMLPTPTGNVTLLVCGTHFPEEPSTHKFGIFITNGSSHLVFPVRLLLCLVDSIFCSLEPRCDRCTKIK